MADEDSTRAFLQVAQVEFPLWAERNDDIYVRHTKSPLGFARPRRGHLQRRLWCGPRLFRVLQTGSAATDRQTNVVWRTPIARFFPRVVWATLRCKFSCKTQNNHC
jgi:hypothetical protein